MHHSLRADLLSLAATDGCLPAMQSIAYNHRVRSRGAGNASRCSLVAATGGRAGDRRGANMSAAGPRGADMCAACPCRAGLAVAAAACQHAHASQLPIILHV